MCIHEIRGDPYEVGEAVFTFLTHVAYLRCGEHDRADEVAEQVMAEETPRIGAHGFTSGYAVSMLRRVKELCDQERVEIY
jgi:hypothetical protein